MKLSVVIVFYNMNRVAMNSLYSLTADYQSRIDVDDYEIIVVDNGSDAPLEEADVIGVAPNVRYIRLTTPPPSPALAINQAISQARGEVIGLMVDGAHILTPGVLASALDMFRARAQPVVFTAQFYLGPGPQPRTLQEGYTPAVEEDLLSRADWRRDGYRLFEIGVPYRLYEDPATRPKLYWFVRMFESNCLFFRKNLFTAVGGCDECFDLPGGGALLPDLCLRLSESAQADVVQLLGEATFHQLHGGVTTNATPEMQRQSWSEYLVQYEKIRGKPFAVCQKDIVYYGTMPNQATRLLMKTG
ncbi:hypothetical protein CWI75_14345 [Kineobactrum sediminis]|uniref:Glycosyltransferase 2-like domain-containing protein n=1 Tax=Kineobactrum sediminis TaxID=1905677 RepID=A0A2N5XZS7_9GAMM|nr:glycosyltransferase family 2 protein [Kineobactrum sediminis]PLW81646.1 hypothetical protein CWI75_14345 [Kineobactrum sediminis]